VPSQPLKGCQKIAVISRLYRQHGAPSVNYPSNILTDIPALRIATLLNSARVWSNRTLDAARIARAITSRARITFSSDNQAVA
jgi:hypothetical protein